jgi:phosphoenolpyruvate-protein phosphotransferase (PTS system enzyme I)
MEKYEEMYFEGKVLSKGIGLGSPVFLDSENFFEKDKISENEVEKEILKFKKALKQSKDQIFQLKKSLAKDKLDITFDILNTHLEILSDPLINKEVESRIKNDKKCIEAIFHDIILDYKNKIKDPFFKEKAVDLADVFKRILSNLRSIKVDVVKNFNSKSVIVSDEIIPSDLFELDEMKISAFISMTGSYESHAAIIARSKNIPFLSKVDIEELKSLNFEEMIVDANNGRIIINPSKETYEKYENLKKLFSENKYSYEKTEINKQCNLYANISNKNEIDLVVDKQICGIGLLRTELFFLEHKEIPNEEIQFQEYKKIALKLNNLPVIIRLFDLGADKLFYHFAASSSNNFFASRGINYLFKKKEILIDQIRAILRASIFGNIYLLIPFVKDVEEILLVKKYVDQIQHDLKLDFSSIKIGSMIETPSAAVIIDDIIKNVDFVSIGTNDLTRYTLASENFNSNEIHKSLIRLIENIIKISKINNRPLFLCGEMTANKQILNKLIDLGISNFSVGIKHFQNFKKIQ